MCSSLVVSSWQKIELQKFLELQYKLLVTHEWLVPDTIQKFLELQYKLLVTHEWLVPDTIQKFLELQYKLLVTHEWLVPDTNIKLTTGNKFQKRVLYDVLCII